MLLERFQQARSRRLERFLVAVELTDLETDRTRLHERFGQIATQRRHGCSSRGIRLELRQLGEVVGIEHALVEAKTRIGPIQHGL